MGVHHLLTALIAFLQQIIGGCQEVTELSLQCNNSLNITSPGYPEPYNGMSGVSWIVTAPLNRRIFISFEDLNTEADYDGLVVRDKMWPSHRRRHSGQHHFPPFLSLSHSVDIAFTPDKSTAGNRRGFHLTASCYEDELATTRLNKGRLELKQDGMWLPMCSEEWDDGKADLACQELGYPGAFESIANKSSDNAIIIRSCERSPHRLQDCSTEVKECRTGIIDLKCRNPGCIGCYNINDMNVNREPTIRVRSAKECIIRCHERHNHSAIIRGSNCYCSNEATPRLQDVANCRLPCLWNTDEPCHDTTTEYVPVFNTRVGFCPQPDDAVNGLWRGEGSYYYGSTVELDCDPQFKLTEDSSTLRCAAHEGRNKFSPEWTGSASCSLHADPEESTPLPVGSVGSDLFSNNRSTEIWTPSFSPQHIPSAIEANPDTGFSPSNDQAPDPSKYLTYTIPSATCIILFVVIFWIFWMTSNRWKVRRKTQTRGEGDVNHTFSSTSYSHTEHNFARIGGLGERMDPLGNGSTEYFPASSDVSLPVENEYICLDKPTPQCASWDSLYPTRSVISRGANANHSRLLPIAPIGSDERQPLTPVHIQTLNREDINRRPLPHGPRSNSDQHSQSSNGTRSLDRGVPHQGRSTSESRVNPEVFYHTLENPELSSARQTTSTRFFSSEETQDEMVANPLYFSH